MLLNQQLIMECVTSLLFDWSGWPADIPAGLWLPVTRKSIFVTRHLSHNLRVGVQGQDYGWRGEWEKEREGEREGPESKQQYGEHSATYPKKHDWSPPPHIRYPAPQQTASKIANIIGCSQKTSLLPWGIAWQDCMYLSVCMSVSPSSSLLRSGKKCWTIKGRKGNITILP